MRLRLSEPIKRVPVAGYRVPVRLLCPLPKTQEFLSASSHELLRAELPQLLEMPVQRFLQNLCCRSVVGVRAAWGLGNDLVDDAQLEQIRSCDSKRSCRFLAHLRTLAVLPQDRRASLDAYDGVYSILHHEHTVCHAERECSARAALTNDCRNDGNCERAH